MLQKDDNIHVNIFLYFLVTYSKIHSFLVYSSEWVFWFCFLSVPRGMQDLGYGILVPQPGIKPMPPALEVQSLIHWTARKVPTVLSFDKCIQLYHYNHNQDTKEFHHTHTHTHTHTLPCATSFLSFFMFGCVGSSFLHVGFL